MKNTRKELRTERRWTQADLARELDVSRQTVNALEAGRYDPSGSQGRARAYPSLREEDVLDPAIEDPGGREGQGK